MGKRGRLVVVGAVTAVAVVAALAVWRPWDAAQSQPGPPAPPAAFLVGRWDVVSVAGQPIPAGVVVVVDYRPDGEVVVEATGDPQAVPAIDRGKLKRAMDAAGSLPGSQFLTMNLKADGFEAELKKR